MGLDSHRQQKKGEGSEEEEERESEPQGLWPGEGSEVEESG